MAKKRVRTTSKKKLTDIKVSRGRGRTTVTITHPEPSKPSKTKKSGGSRARKANGQFKKKR